MTKRAKPGARWRVQSQVGDAKVELRNVGIFDEIVVDDWLHVEQMNDRLWWMQLGGACFAVSIARSGAVTVTLTEGEVVSEVLVGPRTKGRRP